jgi:hypothetical protein
MKKQKEHKPSKLDAITAASAQDYAHCHTLRIVSRRNVLQFEVTELDAEIVALQAAAEKARQRRKLLLAQIDGLGQVIAKR